MKKNIGLKGQLIRYGIALSIAVILYLNSFSNTWVFTLGVLALIIIWSGNKAFSPLYKMFGINTKEVKDRR